VRSPITTSGGNSVEIRHGTAYKAFHDLSISFFHKSTRRKTPVPACHAGGVLASSGVSLEAAVIGGVVLAAVAVGGIVLATILGRRSGRHSLEQRLSALATRLGVDAPVAEPTGVEPALHHLEVVTDRAAEAVAESSADAIRLRHALDTLPQGVVVCDESGEIVFRNARAIALMGGRSGDALAAQAVTDLLEGAWEHTSEVRTLDLYGPPRRTLAMSTEIIDDGRRTLGVIAVIDDVSERRRLEEIRRDFVANVSHELKTPMGALGLLAETLVAETDPQVGRRLAGRIHTEAFRVSRIIDDLLDLSRIEAEEAPPREPVLVSLIMAEAAERVRSAADNKGVKVMLDEPDSPITVLGDRRQLVSALYNLLENAVKFSYDSGTVLFRAAQRDGVVAMEVEDHGIGIPARDIERIFERFYRVDQGRSHNMHGTGLGLSIARHVAANHHGRIEVDSREGEGSTFSLTLPTQSGGG
jgi:two-component system, OmpR family, sensor histidine kinase SenX3